jgi:hypothetical protein
MGIIETLDANEWLGLNARLQTKKNALRKALKEKGVLKKGGTNTFDKYSYFTEAQYKELFTELFSDAGLELSFNEVEYNTFTGSEKQANGRMPKLNFILTDIDTGFYEETTITGEGIDKGDKAGYKAYTGALKYYLANTFMVATGDDPEEDSPAHTMNDKQEKKATEKQIELMKKIAAEQGKNLDEAAVKNWTMKQASDFISKYKGVK